MEIINVEKSRIIPVEDRFIIRKFNNDNYKSLLKLLENLGLKRNRGAEQRIRKYALEGYKKLISEKTKDSKELNKKIKEYKKERNQNLKKEFLKVDFIVLSLHIPLKGKCWLEIGKANNLIKMNFLA